MAVEEQVALRAEVEKLTCRVEALEIRISRRVRAVKFLTGEIREQEAR